MISALTAAKFDLINIPLIYRENLAGLRTAKTVDKTSPLFCQRRAGEKQVAAGTALMTVALSNRKLSLDIPHSEMNQPKTPQFAAGVKHKPGILKHLSHSEDQTIEESG